MRGVVANASAARAALENKAAFLIIEIYPPACWPAC
jgi:hypothetical protein